ncbi:MAG TPA: hypothetical protein VLA52_16455 [Thermohalobaculum sp.]|nr:hypothetical protein [Thermohalobaculum sp.]
MKLLSMPFVGYVCPFLAGYCVAAAVAGTSVPGSVALFCIAGVFGFVSFPAGTRMLARLAGAEV